MLFAEVSGSSQALSAIQREARKEAACAEQSDRRVPVRGPVRWMFSGRTGRWCGHEPGRAGGCEPWIVVGLGVAEKMFMA